MQLLLQIQWKADVIEINDYSLSEICKRSFLTECNRPLSNSLNTWLYQVDSRENALPPHRQPGASFASSQAALSSLSFSKEEKNVVWKKRTLPMEKPELLLHLSWIKREVNTQ